MAEKFKWADNYKKQGSKIFGETTVKSLRVIQRKYKEDFRLFFATVAEAYKGTSFTAEQNRVQEVVRRLDEIGYLIDLLLSPTSKASEEDVNNLFVLTNQVDDEFRFFSDPTNISLALQKRIEESEKKSQVRLEDIVQANRAIKGRMSEAARSGPSLQERFEPLKPAFEPLIDVVKKVGPQMLGPFENIGKLGLTGVRGISAAWRARKERKRTLEREAFTSATLLSGEDTPEDFAKMYEHLGESGEAKVKEDIGKGYGSRSRPSSASGTSEGPFSTAKERKTSKAQQESLETALFSFFNISAYKAKWTRELLESVQSRGTRGLSAGVKEGGILDQVLDTLGLSKAFDILKGGLNMAKGALLLLGETALIAGAAFAGWKLGEWLEKNVRPGGHNLGDFMPIVMATKLGYAIRNARTEVERRRHTSPVVNRVEQLQMQGMSVLDATKQASAEFKQPIYWDSKGKLHREPLPKVSTTRAITGSTPSARPDESSLVGTPDTSVSDGYVRLGDTFKTSMDAMLKGINKLGTQLVPKQTSGADTWGVRNPMLGYLKDGMLDLRE